MRAELAVLIVNYNAGSELRESLRAVADDLAGTAWEGVVVDNASTDGSGDIAAEFAPQVSLVRSATNVGFGSGINRGLAATTAPLVLIVNPDCRVGRGLAGRLRSELDAHPACAIAGPRILDADGGEQGSARGDPDMFTGLFGRTSILRRVAPWLPVSRRNVVAAPAAAGESRRVDWVSGACMLARRAALERVGGFDERYFLYWEDADLCRRLRTLGYEIRYVPDATAVHAVGHSSRTAREASIRAFHRSAYLYYSTHVAPGAGNPKRLLARAVLAARCWWKLRAA